MKTRTAVVLMNLGGPDSPEAIQPFLFNLFNDPAILQKAGWFRWILAWIISRRRAPITQEIYAHLGGKSPLLENTRNQAQCLQKQLMTYLENDTVFVSIAMRYWKPFTQDSIREVADFKPDRIILVPLYPQYSTTTSHSSLTAWKKAWAQGSSLNPEVICCYPDDPGVIQTYANSISQALKEVPTGASYRILFSAHGLPKSVVAQGDPYAWQVGRTVQAILDDNPAFQKDAVICYQSRLGPLKWLDPSTESEIQRAGAEGVGVILVPVTFVSEHSETLVELDLMYRQEAEKWGVPFYIRVPTLGVGEKFIDGLAKTIHSKLESKQSPSRLCPSKFRQCWYCNRA